MNDIPPLKEWMTVSEVCAKLKIQPHKFYNSIRGRKSMFGDHVKLQSWLTLRGLVTTEAAINEYNKKLSGLS